MDFDGTICGVTCDHVLFGYEILKRTEPRYRFQIGQQRLELDRVRDRNEVLDLASIDVTGLDPEALGNRSDAAAQPMRPTRWPNAAVRPGEIVVVCGFPADTRELDAADRTIVSVAFQFVEHVTETDDDSFRIAFDRNAWVSTEDDGAAPEWVAQTDLGG